MDTDINKIETLLSEKKYDEARALITAAVSEKFTPAQRGAALTGMASAYMDITNAINIRYRDALKEAIASMKALKAAETKAAESVRLAEVREKLKN